MPLATLRSGYRGPQAGRPPQAPWGWQGEREANEAELGVSFGPNSQWGYSAFQYILPDQTPKTNRCASRFATTASALRASAAHRGREIAQFP